MIALAAEPSPEIQECLDRSIWTAWMNPGTDCVGTPSVAEIVLGKAITEPWIEDMKAGTEASIKTMVSFWINVPDPNIGSIEDGSKAEVVSFLHTGLLPLVAWIMCFTMLAGVFTIMWTQRAEGAKRILTMILTYLAVESFGAGAIAVALEATNNMSKWLIEQSTQGTNFADNLFSLFDSSAGVGSSILLIILLLIAALVAAFTSLLMIARGGVLLALVGAMQLAVAMSATQAGLAVMRHFFAWILAFTLYKLGGAIVLSVGFRLVGTDTGAEGQGLLQILYGLTLLGMAILALPAIIRLIVPAVAPAAQGRGAGATAAAVGSATTMAVARR